MPKIKTSRMARKKIRVMGKGRLKRARAGTSHLSGKKPTKRIRQLRHQTSVDSANEPTLRRMLPYSK